MIDSRRKKVCAYCGKEFYQKKSNQKFCHPNCRSSYHNNINNNKRRARSFVEKHHHKNFNILLKLMDGKNQESFNKQFLKGAEYSFEVMTHFELHEGVKRKAIYHFLIIDEGDKINVIRYKS